MPKRCASWALTSPAAAARTSSAVCSDESARLQATVNPALFRQRDAPLTPDQSIEFGGMRPHHREHQPGFGESLAGKCQPFL